MKPRPFPVYPPIVGHSPFSHYYMVGMRQNAPLSRDEINFLQLVVEAQAAAQARPRGIRGRVRRMLGMKPQPVPLPRSYPRRVEGR